MTRPDPDTCNHVINAGKVQTTPHVSPKPPGVQSVPTAQKTRGLAMDATQTRPPAHLVVAINAALATLRTARIVNDTITITVAQARVDTLLDQITKTKTPA